jgi:plasmid replication initiation protein
MKTSTLSKRMVVKQSYELNNARYRLGAVEMDIVLKLITEIKKEHEDLYPYRFKVKDIEQRIGKKLNRATLKKAGRQLMSKPLEIPRSNNGFLYINWVSNFEYIASSGVIEVSFDSKLKPYLMQLKSHFVIADLEQLLKLTSEYSKRLYMLFKQREYQTADYEIEVEELQAMLQVPKSAYRYAEFKKSIITPALKQINERTELKINLEEIKEGRKVKTLKFSIKKNTGEQLTIFDAPVQQSKSFKEELQEIRGFYYKGIVYKVNENGLLTKNRRIIKTATAMKLLKEMERNKEQIRPVETNISIFDLYEAE